MKLGEKNGLELNQVQEKRAMRLAEKILRWQGIAAAWLNMRTSGITTSGWLVMLVVFCLGFGGYCLSLVINAL